MNSSSFPLWIALILLVVYCHTGFVHADIPEDCHGQPNNYPFIHADWKLVKTVANGKKYFTGNSSYPLYMIHVWGSDHDMGLAHGQLMADEIHEMSEAYLEHVEKMIEQFLPNMPEKIKDFIARYGLMAALDLTWEMTRHWTPQRFIDEIEGIARGSGYSYVNIRRVNLLPEMIKAACTMYGAWGEATSNTTGLLQLRALDFDKHAPIRKYPLLIVAHPDRKESRQYVNVAWPGLVGSITGISEQMIGISEKVWLTDSDIDTRFGTPWLYVLRDVIEFGIDLDSSLTILANANRTCSIHVGIGDSVTGQFRGVEYSYKELNIYDWSTQPEYPNHPRLKNIVYWDKSKQPTKHACFGQLLKQNYGNLDATVTIRELAARHETGDLQAAVYDFSNKKLYVSNAAPTDDGKTGPLEAYKRPYFVIDLPSIFSESRP